jgi:4-hydroxyacetophenone monooxygenase
LLADGRAAIECKREVRDAYMRRHDRAMAQMVWSHPSIKSSWYRNAEGRVTVLSPWRLLDYWRWTQRPEPSDFTID